MGTNAWVWDIKFIQALTHVCLVAKTFQNQPLLEDVKLKNGQEFLSVNRYKNYGDKTFFLLQSKNQGHP